MSESSISIERLWNSLLEEWTSTGFLASGISSAFGIEINSEKVKSVTDQLLDKGSKLSPDLVELSSANMKNHWGAYSPQTNSIYVDSNLKFYPDLAKEVLAHELGHWVDNQLNEPTTQHEIINLFAANLLGKEINSSSDIQVERNHSHPQTITLHDGQEVPAQFFDTSLHVSWVPLLPSISTDAKSLIVQAQNDTDAFNSWGRTYGLQTNSASHFDKANITGGLTAIRARYLDAIAQFDNTTNIPVVDADPYTGGNNRSDATPNPEFSGVDAGVQLLLYRFGQICHTLEDFYSHSNWVELGRYGVIDSTKLFLEGNDLPSVLQAGDFVPGTNIVLAMSGPNWSQYLQKSSTGSYSGTNVDVYFNVDSDIMINDDSGRGGVISAKTLDGKTIYGLATGAVAESIYKDNDFSVYMEDPKMTAWYQDQYFRGLGHGGFAGTGSGQRMEPINKDNDQTESVVRYWSAKQLAQLQVQNEWNRLGNLLFQSYGVSGLRRFASYAINSPSAREAYVETFSKPGGSQTFIDPSEMKSLIPARAGSTGLNVSDLSTLTFDKSIKFERNRPLTGAGTQKIVEGMNDWLASVDSDLYYTQIGLTFSHDAAAYKGNDTINPGLYLTQEGYTLLDQFNGGVRIFDLKTSEESVADRDTFRFQHGSQDWMKFEVGDDSRTVFQHLFTALANNPSEFIGFNIGVYGDAFETFNSNNKNVKFWDTLPAKNIHSYFFKDGKALQGTPRVWGDDVFSEWGLDLTLPEEKKELLRGRPLFYIPYFGQQSPTIPKLEDLRGKFMLADESGFGRPFLYDNGKLGTDNVHMTRDHLFESGLIKSVEDWQYATNYGEDMKVWPEYKVDNNGEGKYRFDGGSENFYYYKNQRWANRNFMDVLLNLDRKPDKWPSFIGIYNNNFANMYDDELSGTTDFLWNIGEYPGDDGSPSFQDVVLNGKGLSKQGAVGAFSGIYYTDFGARAVNGKSPASTIVEMQPRVEAIVYSENVGDRTIGLSNGLMAVDIRTNIPGDSETDPTGKNNYGVVVRLLSKSLVQKPSVVTGYGTALESTSTSLIATEDKNGKLQIIVPKGDKSKTEYISIQVKDLRTGELFGAPRIYSLPSSAVPSVAPFRQIMLFGASDSTPSRTSASADGFNIDTMMANRDSALPSFDTEYKYQFFDVATGKWLDTDYLASIHDDFTATEATLLQTSSKVQHSESGKRAVYLSEGNGPTGPKTQQFYIESTNANAPVYLNDIDMGKDQFIFVDSAGKEDSVPENLYQPNASERLAKYLLDRNIFVNFRPLVEYAPKSLVVSGDKLKSPLNIKADLFANDPQNSALYFSAFDSSIPFLSLKNGSLVASSIDAKYYGKTYTANVDISNGSSTARNVSIVIAIDPKVTINGDQYGASDNFSVNLNATDQSFTIHSCIINDQQKLAEFVPIASSIGLASGSPAGFNGSALEIGLGDLAESGSVEFWIEDSLGAFKQLDVLTDASSKYSLKLDGKSVATLQASTPRSGAPSLKAISCSDLSFDGLGFDLANNNDNRAPKFDGTPWNVAISYDLYSEASYSNTIGFCLFDKHYGAFIDPVTGNRVQHGNAEWWKNAERLSIWSESVKNSSAPLSMSFKVNGSVDPDVIVLLPCIKVNDGTSTEYYSTFDSLNPDMSSHMKPLGRTAFGFEDMSKSMISCDSDFDDVIFNMRSFSIV